MESDKTVTKNYCNLNNNSERKERIKRMPKSFSKDEDKEQFKNMKALNGFATSLHR